MLLFALAMHVALIAPSALTWEAPAGCPSAGEVQRIVDRYAIERPRPAVRATARVRATGGRFELAAAIDAPEGRTTVELRDADCRVLADAVALMFALHLDAPAASAPPLVSASRPPLHGHVRLFGGAAAGIAPSPSGLLGLALGLGRRSWRGELALTHGLDRSHETTTPGVGYTLRLWSAMLRGCWAPGSGRVQFPLCADLEIGALVGAGAGERVTAARTRPSPWLTVGLGAAVLGWVQPNIGLFLEGRGHLALGRAQFGIDGHGLVYRAPAAGVRLLAGLEVRFDLTGPRRPVTTRRRSGD